MHHFPVKTLLIVLLIALMLFVPIATREYEDCSQAGTVKRFHIIRGEKSDFDAAVNTPAAAQLTCVPVTQKAQLYIL